MSDPRAHIMPVYAPPEEAFVRGEGVRLYTESGDEYLDFIAGIAVNALGHAHPQLVEALQEFDVSQYETLPEDQQITVGSE